MNGQSLTENADLLRRASLALGVSAVELGDMFGVSRRSVSRWMREGTWLVENRATALAKMVHPRDRVIAARLAEIAGQTLVSLGLEAPPPQSPLTVALASSPAAGAKLLDAVVCAAAEAMDASPRAVRPALLAAVRCAREVGLTLEAMEEMLAPREPTKKRAS